MKFKTLLLSLFAAALPSVSLFAAEGEKVVEKTLFQKLNMPTIWILLVFSMVCVSILINLLMATSKKKLVPADQLLALRELFRAGDYAAAAQYCRENPSMFTNVVRTGLAFASDGKEAAEEAMAAQIMRENGSLNNKASFLSITGVVSPMVGLTGTVFGMIDAFSAMGGTTGAADPAKLSGAIGAVLYATASGLLVSIPAFVFFFVLRGRNNTRTLLLQSEVNNLFRRMPYEQLANVQLGDEVIYAATPNWNAGEAQASEPQAQA